MGEFLFYVCDIVDIPWNNDDKIFEIERPLYENIDLEVEIEGLELRDMETLMSFYSYCGERAYYSIKRSLVEENLVKVSFVKTCVKEEMLIIEYHFEDGRIYKPEREILIDEEVASVEVGKMIEIAQRAARYMFFVNLPLTENMFDFEFEQWG